MAGPEFAGRRAGVVSRVDADTIREIGRNFTGQFVQTCQFHSRVFGDWLLRAFWHLEAGSLRSRGCDVLSCTIVIGVGVGAGCTLEDSQDMDAVRIMVQI